jgi:carbamoyl-phosphate synthase small subunit
LSNSNSKQDAILLLQDGTYFKGTAIGKLGITTGEICFNTGMSGYQEIFTDPSYFGQVMVMANTHIGNYGVLNDDTESNSIKISGLVCKSFSKDFSRKRSNESLSKYLENGSLVGIENIDTRALIEHIRDNGAMNCIISSEMNSMKELEAILNKVPSMQGLELSSKVSTKEPYFVGESNAKYKVAVLDFGVKKSILNCIANKNCYLKVFPYSATAKEILSFNPDAFFLSNGPGDPEVMISETELVKELLATNKPLFGICLGHQLLAQALGLKTFKMHNGHRGINHPVKNLITGKCEITSQNHGFAIEENSLSNNSNVEVTHRNLNDNSIEGIRLKNKPVFSVQYHPEASPGPLDSRYLFDDFVNSMA